MADERQQSSSNSSKRRRRRRSSQKRKPSSQSGRTEKGNSAAASSNSESGQRTKRRRRRRRRSRSKSPNRRSENTRSKADRLDAKLPESIFVYTHVLRSSELDTYGFRPDPFLNSSRSLADFRIDLAPLFPEAESDEDDERRIFDAALHGPIVTSVGGPANDTDEDYGDDADLLDDDE